MAAQEGTHLLDDPQKVSGKAWGRVAKFATCQGSYPKSTFFILGNEFCERFSFYGMRTILVIYLTRWLRFGDDTATAIYHAFTIICYFTPLFGAMLADGAIGKYRTILYLSIVYAGGNVLMSLTALPPPEWVGPMIALLLIGIGTGGIKPCVSSFGGDQFSSDQTKELSRFFSIFYFAINLGSVISTLVSPILRADVKCFGGDCYFLAFGTPAVLMIISLVIFLIGKSYYKIYPPTGNVIGQMFSCITHAIVNRCRGRVEPKDHWLDYANDTFEQNFIEDVKAVMRVMFLFIPLPFFWALFDQQGSRWTLQAVKMNGDLGVFGHLKPDQMQALNPILIILLIPFLEGVIYPLLDKCKIPNRPLQRMCAGMLLAAASFVVAGFVDLRIQGSVRDPIGDTQASVQFINAAPCPVHISSDIVNASLMVSHGAKFTVDPKMYVMNFHANEQNFSTCDELVASADDQLVVDVKGTHHYQVVLFGYKGSLIVKQFNYTLMKPTGGGALVSLIYATESLTLNDQVELRHVGGQGEYTFNVTDLVDTPFKEIEIGRYEVCVPSADNASSCEVLPTTFTAQSGAVYSIVIQQNYSHHEKLQMVEYVNVEENTIPLLHQVPQYFLLTVGEILFSVTGLSFSYSQAPASMKAVLQAAWLLTVAVGNLIVVIVAESQVITNQAIEFFLFAGLMAVDTCIFALMAYLYVYIKHERGYTDMGTDQDALVSEPESYALDDNASKSEAEEQPDDQPSPK